MNWLAICSLVLFLLGFITLFSAVRIYEDHSKKDPLYLVVITLALFAGAKWVAYFDGKAIGAKEAQTQKETTPVSRP